MNISKRKLLISLALTTSVPLARAQGQDGKESEDEFVKRLSTQGQRQFDRANVKFQGDAARADFERLTATAGNAVYKREGSGSNSKYSEQPLEIRKLVASDNFFTFIDVAAFLAKQSGDIVSSSTFAKVSSILCPTYPLC